MSALEDIIKDEIATNGAISIARYMNLALGHADHGYYMTRDPLGAEGDFTTAPEISQMFGEILGAWAVDQWMQIGSPERFVLLECGPGRGTLMSDMLRVSARADGFHDAASIVMLETSPVLKAAQSEVLAEFDIEAQWIGCLDELKADVPVIVIANEFLDALPIHQMTKGLDGWNERRIGVNDAGAFEIIAEKADEDLAAHIPFHLKDAVVGSVLEIAPDRSGFISALCGIMKQSGGRGLLIDYGHGQSACGDTLQAVKEHAYCDALVGAGEADITAHVDFEVVTAAIKDAGGEAEALQDQGDFLKSLGIEMRAQMLGDQNPDYAVDIASQLARLISGNEMGRLFKVLEFSI